MKLLDDLTPDMRAEALYYFFGWQDGTVHQLADATGLSVDAILYRQHGAESAFPTLGGMSAIRTCGLDWRVNTLAPRHLRDWPFWRDAMVGYWITGALSNA